MEFDKSKVYTALNADSVKIGSKGYFADNLVDLRKYVEAGASLSTVSRVRDASHSYRFSASDRYDYLLFYLVEGPSEILPSEVTVDTWNGVPRVMRVWDDNFSDAVPRKVIHILRGEHFPVVTADEYNLARYQHCAETEED